MDIMSALRAELERFEEIGPVRFQATIPDKGLAPVTLRPTHVPRDLSTQGKLVPHLFTDACAAALGELFQVTQGDMPMLIKDIGIVPKEMADKWLTKTRSPHKTIYSTTLATAHDWHFEHILNAKPGGLGLSQSQFPTVRPFTFVASTQELLYSLHANHERWKVIIRQSTLPREKKREAEAYLSDISSQMSRLTPAEAAANPRVRQKLDRLLKKYDAVIRFTRPYSVAIPWTVEPCALLMHNTMCLHTGGVMDPYASSSDYNTLRKWMWQP